MVPGDIVLLCLGDKIPADMRIIKILEEPLRVLNTVLTGEPDALTRDALVSSERDPTFNYGDFNGSASVLSFVS